MAAHWICYSKNIEYVIENAFDVWLFINIGYMWLMSLLEFKGNVKLDTGKFLTWVVIAPMDRL